MKALFFVTLLFFSLLHQSSAQTWQWAKMVGTRFSFDQAMNPVTDDCMFLTTDPSGNTYAILRGARRFYTDTDSSREDSRSYVLASWNCAGKFRWMKTFGYGGSVYGLGADTLGGIYMTGYIGIGSGNHIDIDTVIPPAPQGVIKGNFIVKYDTSGDLKWLRMPDPNTITAQNQDNRPRLMRLNVSPNGELDILSYLPVGAHADGGYQVSAQGMYILRYNAAGNFLQGVKLPLTTWYAGGVPVLFGVESGGGFLRDPVNGRYYIANSVSAPASYPALFVGNDTIRTNSISNLFMLCFDKNGNLKWKKTQTDNDIATCADFKLGPDGSVYLSGQINNGSAWNGTTFTAPGSVTAPGFILKMDSLGNNLWSTSYYSPLNETNIGLALSIGRNNTLYAAGLYHKELKWNNFMVASGQTGLTIYGRMFLAKIDPSTGAPLTMDTLSAAPKPVSLSAMTIAQDRNNNVYAGVLVHNPGELTSTIMTVNNTPLNPVGGTTDIAICKFGNANCSPSTTGIRQNTERNVRSVFPNPFHHVIYVSGLENEDRYDLYNAIGQKLLSGRVNAASIEIPTNLLPSGIYYFEIRNADNTFKEVFKVTKQ